MNTPFYTIVLISLTLLNSTQEEKPSYANSTITFSEDGITTRAVSPRKKKKRRRSISSSSSDSEPRKKKKSEYISSNSPQHPVSRLFDHNSKPTPDVNQTSSDILLLRQLAAQEYKECVYIVCGLFNILLNSKPTYNSNLHLQIDTSRLTSRDLHLYTYTSPNFYSPHRHLQSYIDVFVI